MMVKFEGRLKGAISQAVIVLFLCSSAQAATRVALVGSQTNNEINQLLALVEAQLSGQPNLQLLERTAVQRLLQEQKLSLAGFAEANKAVAAGKVCVG